MFKLPTTIYILYFASLFFSEKKYIVEKGPGGSVEDRPPEKREIIYLFTKDDNRILPKMY